MVSPEHVGRQFSWQDVTARHPEYAEDDGIDWAARTLAYAHEGDREAEGAYDDLSYRLQRVPLSKVRAAPVEPGDHRVVRAVQGYRSGAALPPPVLVHRSGGYEVADGHHRTAALRLLGSTHHEAYVAESPHRTPYPTQDY